VSNRWRYPAAFAVTVGIGFPALAAASAGPYAPVDQASQSRQAAELKHGGPSVLTRPARRLHETIDVQTHRIRTEQLRRQDEAFTQLPGGVSQATLDAIGQCESGGDPAAVSADGTYRGKYQFDYGTWASIGGHGDPASAPEAEQDYRAALLYEQGGSSPWPTCG
jgi:hypothetical protein